MEYIDVSNQSLAVQEAEIYRFVIRTTDLKDPVVKNLIQRHFYESGIWLSMIWPKMVNFDIIRINFGILT